MKNRSAGPSYALTLYITGASPNSALAIKNVKSICEKHLKDRYHLEIVDVYQEPVIAKRQQIVALPLLVRSFPLPQRRLIGNMSDTEKVLTGLDLPGIII